MTEVAIFALVLTNLASLAFAFYSAREAGKERGKFVNALVAKSSVEFRDLELTEKVKPIATQAVQTEPDLIPEADLSDEEFRKVVLEGTDAA